MEKIFLLGVGCQKGGTTWLHRYLNNHPNVNMGFKKEYHIFDALTIPQFRPFKERRTSILHLLRRGRVFSPRRMLEVVRFKCLYRDLDCYVNYFDSLINSETFLTGDLTPEYAALSTETFELIKSHLEERGFCVKVIYLMRDPVERCISSMRMYRRNRYKRKIPVLSEEIVLEGRFAGSFNRLHTQYEVVINKLESVFDENDIHYEFYENLFTDRSIEAIAGYLGLPYASPDFHKKVNVSRTNAVISEKLRYEIYKYYLPTYEFLAERYGEHLLKEIWPSYKKYTFSLLLS